MSIRLRKGRWQMDVWAPDGRRVREQFATQAEAILREAEVRAAVVKGTVVPTRDNTATPLTLGQLRDRVIERVWRGKKAEKFLTFTSGQVVDFFGPSVLVTDVNEEAVDRFVSALMGIRNSNATINRKLACLSRMLRFAEERGYIARRPKLERKKEGRGRDRFLTDEEEARVLNTLLVWGKHDERDLTVFLLDTGCRLSEARAIGWQDVSKHSVTFWVNKSDMPRTIPLTSRVKEILARRLTVCVKPFEFTNDAYGKVWDKVRTHIGLGKDKQFVPHALRHTCASRLVQRGVRIEVVQKWLGHKTIQVTMRYAHLAPSNLSDAVNVLEPQLERPRHLRAIEGGQP